MTYQAISHFTALTANIVVAGRPVGALQSLKIDDNYNTVRVGQIGSPIDIAHLPGRVQVNLSARRMVINQDLVMSYLRPAVSNVITEVLGEVKDSNGKIISPAITVSKFMAEQAYQAVSGNNALIVHKYYNFLFDVEVQNPSGLVIYMVKDCNVVSRSVTIDQGSIVISEDVTMFAKYIDYQPAGGNLPNLTGEIPT